MRLEAQSFQCLESLKTRLIVNNSTPLLMLAKTALLHSQANFLLKSTLERSENKSLGIILSKLHVRASRQCGAEKISALEIALCRQKQIRLNSSRAASCSSGSLDDENAGVLHFPTYSPNYPHASYPQLIGANL